MEITLFDFDFSKDQNKMFSDEMVKEKFRELQLIVKNSGNGYYTEIRSLPRDLVLYLEEFRSRGWIENRGDGITIPSQHLIYHTVEEVVESFREKVEKALSDPNVSWYKTVLSVINGLGTTPVRWKDEKAKKEARRRMHEISRNAAKRLGLNHFLAVPSSRGMKINIFSSKFAKEQVLPLIAKYVIPITDYEEMDDFFNHHFFFFGRDDWETRKMCPYPDFRMVTPSMFEKACLCEAKDEKTVKLILDYAGCSFGGERIKKLPCLYPDGWSYERYLETLTEDDKAKIREDQERLKRLHGESYVVRYPWDKRCKSWK